jgi:hypothetical protein
MALGNDNVGTPRTPLPDGQLKEGQVKQSQLKESQKDQSLLKLKEDLSQPVQVPSSNLQHSQEDAGQDEQDEEEAGSDDRVGEPQDNPSDDLTEVADDEQHTEERAVADDNVDLVPMDWTAFETEYIEALKAADEEENNLLTEFDKVFSVIYSTPRKTALLI